MDERGKAEGGADGTARGSKCEAAGSRVAV